MGKLSIHRQTARKCPKWLGAVLCAALLVTALSGCVRESNDEDSQLCAKPVIYLYPEKETDVEVTLDYSGKLTTVYPSYEGGWRVTAMPDGTLVNQADGREYSYLFWEGVSDTEYDFSKGFTVAGEDTAEFLQETLAKIGLTPKEYNEFIVYWLPLMQENPYNMISFQAERYTDMARLTVTPEPDSVLRVFMAFRPLQESITVEPQSFLPFERNGFTVVEWGGCQVNEEK